MTLFPPRKEPSDMAWLASSIMHRRLASFLAALGDPSGPNGSAEFGFQQRLRISEIALSHFDGLLAEVDGFVDRWFDGTPQDTSETKGAA